MRLGMVAAAWMALAAAGSGLAAGTADFVRTEVGRMLIDNARPTDAIVSRLVVRPGGTVAAHTHPGDEIAYVISGSRIRPIGQEPERELVPGDVLRLSKGKVHGFTVIGDRPLELLTVHIVEVGKPMVEFVRP